MKFINYEELFSEFKPDGAISADANLIANTLMRELYISSVYNLARFLGVERCFNNDMAMRVWVQKRLDVNLDYVIEDMRCQLQSELYELLPHSDDIGY